jgi:hypothetical protein
LLMFHHSLLRLGSSLTADDDIHRLIDSILFTLTHKFSAFSEISRQKHQ